MSEENIENISKPLDDCLFGSVKLTKNDDLDTWNNSGNSIGFSSCSGFSLPHSRMGKNVIIFWAW